MNVDVYYVIPASEFLLIRQFIIYVNCVGLQLYIFVPPIA
jgi:hypothetical protein